MRYVLHGRRVLGACLEYAAFALGTLVFLTLLRASFVGTVGRAVYRWEAGPEFQSRMPIVIPTRGPRFTVTVPVMVPRTASRALVLTADDCVESVTVNGTAVDDAQDVFCGGNHRLDLAALLRPGRNSVDVVVKDTGGIGELRIIPEYNRESLATLFAIWTLCLLWGLRFFFGKFPWVRAHEAVLGVFLAGVTLRLFYVLTTTFTQRSHDFDGHVAYITHILEHGRIPLADAGWEFHQAPLYYALSALWMRLGELIGRSEAQLLNDLQIWTFVISCAMLGIGVWAGAMLLRDRPAHGQAVLPLFGGLLATFPALVLTASPLSNDALYQMLAFLTFALLLRWWRRATLGGWLMLCAVAAIAFLTKVSGLLLIALIVCAFALHPIIAWKGKARWGLIGIALMVLLAGWYPLLRLGEPNRERTFSLGNRGMNAELQVGNTWRNYLTFSPAKVLQIPFNDSWKDEARRQYFWEYFFRSAFFGETRYEAITWLAHNMLFLALTLLPLMAFGLLRALVDRFRDHLPVLLTLLSTLGGALLYRWQFPYAPNQDFRFSLLLLPPAVFFLTEGVLALPDRFRSVARAWVGLFSFACAAFIVLVCAWSL